MGLPSQPPVRRSLSVGTPVYNGEASVAELCRRLGEVLPRVATQYEIILVNDGSRDRSWEVISELSSRSPTVRGTNRMRNYGQHNALLCGIRTAKYEMVATMDDDLQHRPEEIPRLLAQLDKRFDVVYGASEEGSLPGFPFLASIIAIFSGAQLLAIGVIGGYLARMHYRSMKRPAYVVRMTT